MNIFVLDENPNIAASMACDKHVVKMIVETAQMMCTVVSSYCHDTPYRPTHAKHPCTLWAGQSRANWDWLIKYGMSLCKEYTGRYDRTHKSQDVIEWCAARDISLPLREQTPFAQAMPPQYRDPNPVVAYRSYYHGEKSKFAKWKHGAPRWWSQDESR